MRRDDAGDASGAAYVYDLEAAPNQIPLVSSAISDTTLDEGGEAFVHELEGPLPVFFDPDRDVLSYSARSSDELVATAAIENLTTLIVAPVLAGAATVTVTATDSEGDSVSTSFVATVMGRSSLQIAQRNRRFHPAA